jgi:anaerobic ribonucleoside-triphosphate reductase activating protein
MSTPLHVYRSDRNVLRVAQVVEQSRSEGPDVRFCLWLQGCELRCPGCCNPEMFDFASPAATDVPVARLVEQIRAVSGIEGITLLGGEPFHQAPAAAALAVAVRELGLGVMVFTGYYYADLVSEEPASELLSGTDLLIAGPFVTGAHSVTRPWVGSDNQEVHLLSPRYHDHPALTPRHRQSVHMQVQDGELRISGWPGVVDVVKKTS